MYCKNCGEEIDNEKTCPHCKVKTSSSSTWVFVAILIIVIGVVFTILMNNSAKPTTNDANMQPEATQAAIIVTPIPIAVITPSPIVTPSPSPSPSPTPFPDITLGMTYEEYYTLCKYMSLKDVMPEALTEIDKDRSPNIYDGKAKNGVTIEAIIDNRSKRIGSLCLFDDGHTEALFELSRNALLIFNGDVNIDHVEALHDMFAYVYSSYLRDNPTEITDGVKHYSSELHIGNFYYQYLIVCEAGRQKITLNSFFVSRSSLKK